MKRVHVLISGRVQGVFFRAETLRTALSLGLAGWVLNREDGCVEALFEGEDESVDRMLAWCRQGPPHARVDRVDWTEEPWRGDLKDFRIKDF
ncbi:MAG TPA: acylphosphatase [Smithellaceae bacterium]|nr:acylphosphatase [Smithellaceae bacterium]HRS83022.1 acylphosphatase [Smithellaceae bacterium]HRV45326.1 acylphosphatase [Smithellaceae bacterium]